jgi:hypothetical protein
MKRYKSILLGIFTLLMGCKNDGYNLISSKNIFSSFKKKIEFVVVIPIEGCTGCISEVTQYLLKNHPDGIEDCAIVFTNIRDRKGVRILLKPISNLSSVTLDFENRYYVPKSELVNYPVIYERSGSSLKKRKYESKDSILFIRR